MDIEDIDFRPIIIPKATIDVILSNKKSKAKPIDVLGLYTFYYYTAIWQKTNQPRCDVAFASKGLKTSRAKIREGKKALIQLKLIQEVIQRSKNKGHITGHFIKVQYYQKTPPSRFTTGSESLPVVKSTVNAYSNNKENAYSNNIFPHSRDGEGFLNNPKKTLWCTPLVIKLYKTICKKRKLQNKKINMRNWETSFDKMYRLDGLKKSRIKKILKWYCKHVGEEYIPQAYSADSFRVKFLHIEDAYHRDEIKTDFTLVCISKQSKKIVKLYSNKSWPNNSAKDLPQVVQVSLDNYKQYYKAHHQLIEDLKGVKILKLKRIRSFAQYIDQHIIQPQDFVERWIDMAWEVLDKWNGWNGKLNRFIFTPYHTTFTNEGREWAWIYCNDSNFWERYTKQIIKITT